MATVQTTIDPQEAFEAAIQLGTLSADETDENFAGSYMYMFTDEQHGHAFKRIDDRTYVYTGD